MSPSVLIKSGVLFARIRYVVDYTVANDIVFVVNYAVAYAVACADAYAIAYAFSLLSIHRHCSVCYFSSLLRQLRTESLFILVDTCTKNKI